MPDAPPGTDLRLVPAALAAWTCCAVAVGAEARDVVVLGGTLAAAAAAAGLASVAGWSARRRSGPVRSGRAAPWPAGGTALGTAWLTLAALIAVTASCAVQLNLRQGGLLGELVAARAVVEVVGVVRAEVVQVPDPWPDADRSAESAAGADPVTDDDGPAFDDSRRYRTVIAVERVTGRGRTGGAAAGLLVLGGAQWTDVPYGARVQVSGRLGAVDGGELRGLISTSGDVRVVDRPGAVDRAVTSLRSALLEVTDGLPPDARGLVPGAAIGDTSRLPADLDQAMRDVGLTHVTAVSGGHFAVLSLSVLGLTSLLRLPRPLRALVSVLVMAGFVLLVHPEPSVVRAAAMGALAAIGLLIGRPSRAAPALGGAVILLLVLDPWLARSYGFVLSVLATGAIVLLAPPLAEALGRLVPRGLAVAVAVPAAAQAVCAPVIVLLDPAVSVYAVPANLVAAPALLPATLLGVAATLTAPWFPALAGALAHGAGWATWWIAEVARFCAALPGARHGWPAGPGGLLLLLGLTAVALVLVIGAHRVPIGRRRLVLAAALCLALLLVPQVRARVLGVLPDGWPPPGWRTVLCDVGQGDTLVVRSGPSAAVVIDVGPDGRAADDCLDALGIDRIELLLLTHFHADHVGGLDAVLAGRQVDRAVVSPFRAPAGQVRRAEGALDAAGVPTEVGLTGGSGQAGEVRWTVLRPDRAPGGPVQDATGQEINDASVVVLLEAPDLTVLALGDVEPTAQDALLVGLRQSMVGPPDVVKVAHHGSANQSEDLAGWLGAPLALVSAGADNTYGHPAASTIDLYRSAGSVVLSTHVCGDIGVSGDLGGGRLLVTARCLG